MILDFHKAAYFHATATTATSAPIQQPAKLPRSSLGRQVQAAIIVAIIIIIESRAPVSENV